MTGWDSLSWEAKRGAVLAQALFTCEICQDAPAIDVDHIWPRSKGGPDDRSNLRAACKSCNRSKGDAIWITDLDVDATLPLYGANHYRYVSYSAAADAARWSAFVTLRETGLRAVDADRLSMPSEAATVRLIRLVNEAIDEVAAIAVHAAEVQS